MMCLLAGAGCTTSPSEKPALQTKLEKTATYPSPEPVSLAYAPITDSPEYMYREIVDNGFRIVARDTRKIKPSHVRQVVDYATTEKPGTIIVDQKAHFLYFILPDDRAVRYAIGVGSAAKGFQEGDAIIDRKQTWPRWIPTPDMVRRSPEHYEKYRDGVDGGPTNPLGARALYMQKNGRDTYYRVHGTNDPSSIGKSVSAGCIRLLNQDILDLYERVKIGARIVVQ